MKDYTSQFENFLKVTATILGAGYTCLFFFLSIPRLLFPYEIDWVEGGMLNQALRIFQGKVLFTAPSVESVNWLYQPLYYYATAGAMHFFGITYLAGRSVSFISILICAALIFFLIFRETKSWWYGFAGISLLLASYGFTGYWFEMARVDTLALAFLLASIVLLCTRKKIFSLIISSFFLALSFFTKQQSVFYIAPIVIWLFLLDWRNALKYCIAFIFFIAAGLFLFSQDGGRWYFYFTFTVPQAMQSTLQWDKIITVFPFYLLKQFAAGSLMILYFWLTSWNNRKEWAKSNFGLFSFLTITAVLQLGFQLGHSGTYKNIALPLAAMMAALFPLAIFHIVKTSDRRVQYFALMALCIQLIGMFYSFQSMPLVRITKKEYEAGSSFIAQVRSIPGKVFIPHHDFFAVQAGKQLFANISAEEDCYDVGDSTSMRLHSDFLNAFINKQYDAIIVDEGPLWNQDSIPGYTLSREVNIGKHQFILRASDAVTIPRYLFLPKK